MANAAEINLMPVPKQFAAFPYKPYPQQTEFMQSLFATCEAGGVGLLESPTGTMRQISELCSSMQHQGTGKTISIICSALAWLEEHRRHETDAQQAAAARTAAQSAADGDPDWLRDVLVAGATQANKAAAEPRLSRVAQARRRQRARLARLHTNCTMELLGGGHSSATATRAAQSSDTAGDELGAFALEDGEEEGETGHTGARRHRRPAYECSSDEEVGGAEQQEELHPQHTQVIFCSRTHSQLSQFVREIAHTQFAEQMAVVALASRRVTCINEAVSRGAGAALVNEQCLDLQRDKRSGGGGSKVHVVEGGRGSTRSSKKKGGCPYMVQAGEQYEGWVDDVMGGPPLDVEELVKHGRVRGVCPYYGARSLVGCADVVLAPYASVLSAEARDAVGLRLGGAVLVVDEAHNLVDAVNGVHTHEVGTGAVRAARGMLCAYLERFKARLSPRNAQRVQTLIVVAGRLLGMMDCSPDGTPLATEPQKQGGGMGDACTALRVNDFLLSAQLGGVNFFELLAWVREVRLAAKLGGYSQWQEVTGEVVCTVAPSSGQAQAAQGSSKGGRLGSLHAFLGFLSALTSADEEGRVIVTRTPQQAEGMAPGKQTCVSLRFVLLNAAARFAEVLTSCRAVILASGTLAPVMSTATQLFPGLLAPLAPPVSATPPSTNCDAGKLHVPPQLQQLLDGCPPATCLLGLLPPVLLSNPTLPPLLGVPPPAQCALPAMPRPVLHFECGHVVPREHVECMVVCKGPTGRQLELRHAQRSDVANMDEVARLLLNVCGVVPGGLVVFVPSFAYLAQLLARWTVTGVLASISARKRVFSEPRGAEVVEGVLREYAAAIAQCNRMSAGPVIGSCNAPGSGGGCSGGAGSGHSHSSAAQQQAVGGSSGGGAGAGRQRENGALLLAVVGGKMSEGINFGDELGRCVVVVGLPYANPSDPELRERMAYADARAAAAAAGGSAVGVLTPHNRLQQSSIGELPPAAIKPAEMGKGVQALTGQALYEGMCLNAVNQCIGRVVRHARDYAAVLLVDARYAAPTCSAKLPRWIQGSLSVPHDFGTVMGGLARFYRRHRQQAP